MKKYIHKIKELYKKLSLDRGMFMLYAAIILISIASISYVLINVRPSDLQLVSHYTAFGTTHLYRAIWINQETFFIMIATTAVLHIAIAQMMLEKVSRPIAQIVAWIGIALIIFTVINASLVINVWSPL